MTFRPARWSFVMLAFAAPLHAQSADEALDHAVAVWSKVKTARATFDQTVTNSLTGSSATAHGEFQEQRPNRVSIRFTDPAGVGIDLDFLENQAVHLWLCAAHAKACAPGKRRRGIQGHFVRRNAGMLVQGPAGNSIRRARFLEPGIGNGNARDRAR